jgi:hypothetical protein
LYGVRNERSCSPVREEAGLVDGKDSHNKESPSRIRAEQPSEEVRLAASKDISIMVACNSSATAKRGRIAKLKLTFWDPIRGTNPQLLESLSFQAKRCALREKLMSFKVIWGTSSLISLFLASQM